MEVVVVAAISIIIGIVIDYSTSSHRGADYFRNAHWSDRSSPSVISRLRSLRRSQGE